VHHGATRVGDGGQRLHADIHANDPLGGAANVSRDRFAANLSLGFDREADVPTAGGERDGCGQDPRGAGFEPAGQLAGRLMGTDAANAWQHQVMTVRLDADRAGREPHRLRSRALATEPREPDPQAGSLPGLGVRPVLECPG
jgi:hypothetical protein